MRDTAVTAQDTERRSAWKHGLKTVLFFFLYYSGLERLLARWIDCDAAAILMYHGICERPLLPDDVNFHVAPGAFERQLALLGSRYRFISLTRLIEMLASGERLHKCLVITFDDGYENNALLAAPILRRHRAPACIFLATRYVGTSEWIPLNEVYALWAEGKINDAEMRSCRDGIRLNPTSNKELLFSRIQARAAVLDRVRGRESFAMLSWEQVRELSENGIEFGSHTHSHCTPALEPPEVLHRELVESKRIMEQRLGAPARLFAYPYGRPPYVNGHAREVVADCGFACALTTEPGLVDRNSDALRLPRVGCDRHDFMTACELLYLFAKKRAKDVFRRRH